IWVDRTPDRLFVIYARCTHLGCTPDWKASENKFKCPCHGSGYDNEGVNFEGPAPRPMDRAHVELAPDGQIVVDVSRLYQWPKGQPSHFSDPGSFLQVEEMRHARPRPRKRSAAAKSISGLMPEESNRNAKQARVGLREREKSNDKDD